jgi:hypothetical protein
MHWGQNLSEVASESQYAEARCYPKKRIFFNFQSKTFSKKQAIFIIEIFSYRVKARTQKKI